MPSASSTSEPAPNDRSQPGDDLVVAGPFADHPVVDQLAQRPERRVLVGDPDQQQLFEAHGWRLRLRADTGERAREAIEDEIQVVPEVAPDVAQRPGHAAAPERLESRGQEVSDFVEQPESDDVAGTDRRGPRLPDRVHARGEVADRGQVGDEEIAAGPEQRVVDLVALARGPANVELAHARQDGTRPEQACDPGRRHTPTGRQTPSGSVGRSAATWSMARRSSSSPDGSNS